MKEFDDLVEVAQTLLGPKGCLWDHKQTFFSLQAYVLEEAYEVIEAVDGQKDVEIIEELGDLLYTVLFYAKIAEKEGRFSIKDVLVSVKEKLVRRHPHVFGSLSLQTEEEIIHRWEEIKKMEEGKRERTSALQGIPEQLPLLAKAQKMLKIFVKTRFMNLSSKEKKEEKEIADTLWALVCVAEKSGVDIESLCRRSLSDKKKEYCVWENKL